MSQARTPFIEPLEDRRHFAVTVTEGSTGFYYIQGDNQDNTINVAVSDKNQTFALDGTTYQDAQFISVESYGGQDTINVISGDGNDNIGAYVDAGSGDDTITLNLNGAVHGGSGRDVIYLSDSFYGGAYGEGGDDFIHINGECVSAEIQGGDGNDMIDCSGSTVPVVVHGGAGSDTIYGSNYDDQLFGESGSDDIEAGSGNDEIYATSGDRDTIFGGDGDDILHGNGTEDLVLGVEQMIVY